MIGDRGIFVPRSSAAAAISGTAPEPSLHVECICRSPLRSSLHLGRFCNAERACGNVRNSLRMGGISELSAYVPANQEPFSRYRVQHHHWGVSKSDDYAFQCIARPSCVAIQTRTCRARCTFPERWERCKAGWARSALNELRGGRLGLAVVFDMRLGCFPRVMHCVFVVTAG